LIAEADFAAEERRLGRGVHECGGVWWATVQPFYCKPVNEFRQIARGAARPALAKSLLGYSHQVPSLEGANRSVTHMVLEGEDLGQFGIGRLRGSKRNQVRKGLSLCEVRPIRDLDTFLERMRAINIAQARRIENLGERGGFLPSKHYESHAEQWRRETRREFTHRGKQWWGAFHGDLLVAYLVSVEIGDVKMIGAVKSDPAGLQFCPVDALYFTVLEAAGRDAECNQVVNGGPGGERPGLTHFKEQFLFRQKPVPYFTSNAGLRRLGVSVKAGLGAWKTRLKSVHVGRGETSEAAAEGEP
jgi:hypothetical protein